MAQSGQQIFDGKTITVKNDSGTTAITAGELCYAESGAAIDDVLTGTFASARAAYAGTDIMVKGITCSATGYRTIVGVAVDDIPAGETGSMAMEGVFIHAVAENVEAGGCVQAEEAATNRVQVADNGTTASYEGFATKVGRALTGGSAAGKFIIWKLAL